MPDIRRVLVVDDQPDLRDQLAKFIVRSTRPNYGASLAESMRARILGRFIDHSAPEGEVERIEYDVDLAGQGAEALDKVNAAKAAGRPYWLIFLDMRMPPGWDGMETMQKLWLADPKLQIVLCTAYSDYSWQEVVSKVGIRDNLLILKKPFDTAEVAQLALSLTEKYKLESLRAEQSEEMERINQNLAQEVAERKTMTEALRYTRNCLNNVFRSIQTALVSVSPDGIVTQWNNAAEQFAGLPVEQAVGARLWETMPFMEAYKSQFEAVVVARKSNEIRNVIVESMDGVRHLNVFMSPLLCDSPEGSSFGVEGVVVRVDDVTESVRMDERLRQTQKMDMVGNLAAGLAHDFKNVIGGISSTASSIRLSMDMADSLEDLRGQLDSDLAIVEDSCRHGAEMVKQLLNLSRKDRQATLASAVNLREAVENTLAICRKSLDQSVDVRLSLPEGEALVMAMPSQLEQVILNLIVNASHAMTIMRPPGTRQGGILSVSLERVTPSREPALWTAYPEAPRCDHWLLKVSDTGIGMTREVQSKIFDPFFTTKGKGVGTGLGLSMVFNIVRDHGGFVDVASEVGVGTAFSIYLPSAEADSANGAAGAN